MPGYAVVDLETTGLNPARHHRIVEIGIVQVSPEGEVEDSWCTLVNPERDLGPQHIHGITAADVLSAPTFADIAGDVAARLRGRAFVAHNASFDARFLSAAYQGLGYDVPIGPETTVCTMRWSGHLLPHLPRTLAGCCSHLGLPLEQHHSALSDATAAAALLAHLLMLSPPPAATPWQDVVDRATGASWPALPAHALPPVARGSAFSRQVPFLSRLVDSLPAAPHRDNEREYLALLDRALLDRFLSVREQEALVVAARDFGIDQPTAVDLHREYLLALARSAWRDSVVTEEEMDELHEVAALLGLDPSEVDVALADGRESAAEVSVPQAGESRPSRFELYPGDLVVFTGQMHEPREIWEERARAAGLVPHGAVTKKVALVVAADPDSLSGKARKAAGYGIPIVTEAAFSDLLLDVTAPA
ncbi:exonuclease domain-containing protein [Georgenia phoenicis]|uniref:exonuclease domain-containing protein n=1 Tax=unclassified Georgenia TaxID=2626815 RepID=UPI0039AF1C59